MFAVWAGTVSRRLSSGEGERGGESARSPMSVGDATRGGEEAARWRVGEVSRDADAPRGRGGCGGGCVGGGGSSPPSHEGEGGRCGSGLPSRTVSRELRPMA